jgi:hypothetical protein
MNVTRNGKIARLPKTIRDELNRRLADGERGTELVAWLNGLPEVQRIIAEQFGGRPMRPQNLSEWKHGGYKDWQNAQEAMELVRQLPADGRALKGPDGELFSDILATWLTARYAALAHQLAKNGELDWKRLRELCSDVSTLRRGDHSAQRLKLEQSKLEHARKQTEDEMVAQFVRWVKDPTVQELLRRHGVSAEGRGGEATDGADDTDTRKVSQRVSEPVGQRSCARRASSGFRVQGSELSRNAKRTHSPLERPVTRAPICFGAGGRNGSVTSEDFAKRTHFPFVSIGVDSSFKPKIGRIRLNPTFEVLTESFNE